METTAQNVIYNVTGMAPEADIFFWCLLPYCQTDGCDRVKYGSPLACPQCSKGMVVGLFIVHVIMGLFIFFGNLGIILVITRNKIFHNSFNMFKCSLAIADVLVGILVVPSGAYEIVNIFMRPYEQTALNRTDYLIALAGQIIYPDSACHRIYQEDNGVAGMFMSIVSVLSVMASIFHLVLLSIDRYLAGRALNNRLAAFLIFVVWTTSIILSVVVPLGLGQSHFRHGLSPPMIFTLKTTDGYTGMLYAAFALGLPFFCLLGLNFATALMLFNKRGKIRRQTSISNQSNSNAWRSNEVKATITLLVMVLVFTITTIPAMAAVMFYNGATFEIRDDLYLHAVIYIILILLLVSNSAWNFIIYSWRNKNFRKALKELLTGTRNGKRRRFRWKTVKRAAQGHSEKKKRRKKLSKLTVNSNCNDSEKTCKITTIHRRTMPSCTQQTSIRSNCSTTHRTLGHMPSTTSTVSGSSIATRTSISTQHSTVSEYPPCSSPTILEEDDIFFANNTDEKKPIRR